MLKVDCFVLREDSYARQEMARRQDLIVGEEPPRSIPVASPEDIILQKLEWYQKGCRASDRQWMDVVGVIKVQSERLDLEYLRLWGAFLGVMELLDRALEDGGIGVQCTSPRVGGAAEVDEMGSPLPNSPPNSAKKF